MTGQPVDDLLRIATSALGLQLTRQIRNFTGLHRSPHLGFSVNFAEYRPYRPGDDIRKIDWKVFGRLDRYFVKEYEGETNTSVSLVLDCSRSMAFQDRGIRKLEYGQFLAASLGYFAFKQRDSVGFAAYDHQVREHIPARGSFGHLNTVLHAIEQVYRTRAPGEGRLETHFAHLDLQLVVAGEELIELVDLGRLRAIEDGRPGNDVAFYAPAAGSILRLGAGDAALLFPAFLPAGLLVLMLPLLTSYFFTPST